MSISFSKDNELMFFDSPKGMHLGDLKKAYKRVAYVIHSESQGVLNTRAEREDRKDSARNLVSRDLVIKNAEAFCWNRSGWQAGSCTKSIAKCR